MNHKHYLVSEKDSENVFAVVKDIDADTETQNNFKLIEKVAKTIQDEFCYEKVKVYSVISVVNDADIPKIFMGFDCITEDDEEEVREVELNLVTVY